MAFTRPTWNSTRIATRVWHAGRVDSTQAEAKRLVNGGQGEGALVLAEAQSAGRGRHGRDWHSPLGNLYASCVLQPMLPLGWWGTLTLIAALSVAETVDRYIPRRAVLKWPNDVQVAGKKLAGVLAEVEENWLVLGIGVNLNADLPPQLAGATSVRQIAGTEVARERFLGDLVERLDGYVQQAERGALFGSRWTERMTTLGQRVRLPGDVEVIEGLAETVRDDGALIVRRADGTLAACYGGEIEADSPA